MPLNAVESGRHTQKQVEQARLAAIAWKAATCADRMIGLQSLQASIVKHMDVLVSVIATDTRQPLMDALVTEVHPVLEAIRYYRKHTRAILRPQRRKVPLVMWPATARVKYNPFGVVLVIAPWNFPFQLGMVPAICALAAGNAVIIKPSERLEEVHAITRQIIDDSQLPPGLLQVVTGGPDVGQALVEARPDKIFFTGGLTAGRHVARQAADLLIPCDLELSGKDPMIVFADANLGRAAKAAVWGGFFHTGQVCVSTERVYVEASIMDSFSRLVIEETAKLRQAADGTGDIGVLTVPETWWQVKQQLDDAVSRGARVLIGGLAANACPPVFPPTVLADVTEDMSVMQDETFGPLLPISAFTDEMDVVARVNATPFGLNASVFTRDMTRAKRIVDQLDTGCVFVNDVLRNMSNMDLPFGGVKSSGQGRYRGPEGLLTFSQTKSIMISRGFRAKEINWFPYQPNALSWIKSAIRVLYRR